MQNTKEASLPHPGKMSLFATERKDLWWLGPLATALGLGAFGVYSFWAALQGTHYEFGPYLSPFYSPLIQIEGFPLSPAFLILWAPLGFRATCYYYRKAYYRAFFADPVGCAVGEHRGHHYKGEAKGLFLIQNIHRYFMYIAVLFIGILGYDAVKAYFFEDGFHVNVGSLILTLNVCLLASYTFGCHSLRHVVGGKVDCFSCTAFGRAQHKAWTGVSWFNGRHMLFAWCSLFTVGFSDLYVRMCSMGIFNDMRIF